MKFLRQKHCKEILFGSLCLASQLGFCEPYLQKFKGIIYDLAQTMNSPVKAANSGKVIYADRLGLYGNCVIIDHGYSLQSLYGHMSKLLVKVGDMVGKEQQIGISEATGMAFGDHVHFSMTVAGVQIDPKEWWDEHWIHDRILSKIGSQQAGPENAKAASQPVPKHKKGRRR